MRKKWCCRIIGCFTCLLLLVAGATNAAAQSGRATLLVMANVVTSTAIVFNADGTAQIITANGPDGFSVRTVQLALVPGQLSTLASGPMQTFTAGALLPPQSTQTNQPVIATPVAIPK